MQLLGSLFTPSLANRFLTAFTCVAALAVVLRYCFLGTCALPRRVRHRTGFGWLTVSDTRDISKCGALMNDGEWLDRPPEGSSAVPTEWQPPGCMIHKYTPVEASSCLMGRRVVFAGDSMLRQVFWGIAQKLDKTADPASAPRQSDIMVERLGVKLEFIWDPYLNSSRVKQELNRFKGDSYSGQKFERPSIMLMGAGLWYARYDEVDGLKNWKDSIDEVVTFMRSGRETTDVTKQDLVLLTPVTVPAWSKLSKERARTMTPKKVGEMNQYLQQISDIHGIDVMWSFNRMIKGLPQTMDDSGTHRVNQVLSVEADALLNMRCNANFSPNYPYDKTCCSKYEAPNYQQWFILAFSLGVAPLILILRCKGVFMPPSIGSFITTNEKQRIAVGSKLRGYQARHMRALYSYFALHWHTASMQTAPRSSASSISTTPF